MNHTTYIWIMVDTHGITQKNKNSKIVMIDNHGEMEKPNDPKNYVATVYKNNDVVWLAIADLFNKNKGRVVLESVVKKSHDGGADILVNNTNRKGSNGLVTGKVVNHKVTGKESYNINLVINGENYTIDPQLQMHDD